MQDKVHPTILLMKLKHHSCSVDAACVSTCCLSQIPEPNKSVNHEKITRLLANDFHSSKKESQRLPEIGNSLLLSGTLFITFTELHWTGLSPLQNCKLNKERLYSDIFWVTDHENLFFVSVVSTDTVLLGHTLVH